MAVQQNDKCLVVNGQPPAAGWLYLDVAGGEQGPFDTASMAR